MKKVDKPARKKPGRKPAAKSSAHRDALRTRILAAATKLLTSQGRDAVTTRAVADATGIQPPTLYRMFKDKTHLLRALAEHGFAAYIAKKPPVALGGDPIEDLRRGWDLHVEFGLSNPEIYVLMYGDPQPSDHLAAENFTRTVLLRRVQRIAASGRLRVNDMQAADLYHAAVSGVVFTLLAMPPEQRDLNISNIGREAILAGITTEKPIVSTGDAVTAAITMNSLLSATTALTKAECLIMSEWLERIARHGDLKIKP